MNHINVPALWIFCEVHECCPIAQPAGRNENNAERSEDKNGGRSEDKSPLRTKEKFRKRKQVQKDTPQQIEKDNKDKISLAPYSCVVKLSPYSCLVQLGPWRLNIAILPSVTNAQTVQWLCRSCLVWQDLESHCTVCAFDTDGKMAMFILQGAYTYNSSFWMLPQG